MTACPLKELEKKMACTLRWHYDTNCGTESGSQDYYHYTVWWSNALRPAIAGRSSAPDWRSCRISRLRHRPQSVPLLDVSSRSPSSPGQNWRHPNICLGLSRVNVHFTFSREARVPISTMGWSCGKILWWCLRLSWILHERLKGIYARFPLAGID